jgi:hypothetical protein
MLDKILYSLFGWIDEVCLKIQLGIENLYNNKQKNKKKKK